MKYFYILFMFLLVGCHSGTLTKADQQHFDSLVVKAENTAVGRLYYIHGYYNTIESFRESKYPAQLEKQFHDKGWEIVYIDWPALHPAISGESFSSDQGKAYVDSFKSYIAKLDASLTPVPVTVIGGFSFGGLHAVWASEVIPTDAVFGMQSLVIVNVLEEFKGVDTTYADMTSHVLPENLWLSYGTLDDRVDGPMIANIVELKPYLHAYITDHTENYNTGAQQSSDMTAWLSATLPGGF